MKKTSLVIFISYLFILFSCSDPNKDSESFDNKEQENKKDSKILTVTITEENKYFIGEEEVEANNLNSALTAKKEEAADGLMIQVEGNSDHSTVVKLMDEARNSGIESISITEI